MDVGSKTAIRLILSQAPTVCFQRTDVSSEKQANLLRTKKQKLVRTTADARSPQRKTVFHQEISESIIGCGMQVLNTLRPGLDEKLYENAMLIELHKRGH